jgi:hypothetical protein
LKEKEHVFLWQNHFFLSIEHLNIILERTTRTGGSSPRKASEISAKLAIKGEPIDYRDARIGE